MTAIADEKALASRNDRARELRRLWACACADRIQAGMSKEDAQIEAWGLIVDVLGLLHDHERKVMFGDMRDRLKKLGEEVEAEIEALSRKAQESGG